jgi:hypothetical protein
MSKGLKQITVPVPFKSGINDNTVDEMKDIKQLQSAKNGWFNEDFMFESCNGYSKLDELNSYSFVNTFNYKGSFLASSTNRLYSYTGINTFSPVGYIDTMGIQTEGVYRSGSLTATNQDMYINPNTGIAAISWFESGRGIIYAIYDTNKKTYLISPTVLDSLGVQCKVCYVSTSNRYIFLSVRSGTTTIASYSYNMNTNALSTATVMATDIRASNIAIDCIQYLNGDGVTVGYANTSNTLTLFNITRDNVLGTSLNGYYNLSTDSTISIQKALSLSRVNTDFIVCYNELSSVNVKSRWFGSDFVALSAIQSLGTLTASTTANNITAVATGTATAQVFVDEINATYNYGKLFTASITKTASSSSLTRLSTGTMIAGKALLNAAGVAVVICIYKSNLQSSYFLIGSNGIINGQFSVGVAGDNSTTSQLANVTNSQLVGNNVYTLLLNKGKLSSEFGLFTTISGLVFTKLQKITYRSSVEMNDSLYLSGGIPKVFDGKSVYEAGFTLYPEGLSVTLEASGAGGTIDVGTYSYKAVFEYYDSTGRLHESKTSTALQYTVTTGGATHSLTVRVPSVLVSEKDSVIVSLYRTTNGGTVYYKVTSLSSPTTITPSSNTYVDIVDTLADTTITSNQPIYTTGNLLDNAIFPACNLIKNINGRLWFGLCENRRILYYSQLSNQFQAVKTASEFYYDTLEGGDVIGLAEFGNSCAVFKDKGIYVIVGAPALNTGSGSSLQPIRKIVNNITSTNYRAVYETVDGVFFMSAFGIQLLQYDGNLNNFAKPINNRMVPTDINYIVYIEKFKHLRLHTDTTCWVYDYINNSWYEWEYFGSVSGTVIGNYEVFAKTDGYIRQEGDIYSVDNSPITMSLKTGWLRMYPVSIQRVYAIWPMLKYFSDHKIQFRLYQDNEVNPNEIFDTQSYSITGSTDLYGGGPTYGGGVYYGGDIGYNSVYQPELQPADQECECLSLEIIVYNNGNSIGKGCGIMGLSILGGVDSQILQRKQSKRISGV